MDRRSWLWRRKSSDKSPGETESSGSISSHYERFSDDQAHPNYAHALSPEVTSKVAANDVVEVGEDVKTLSEKLSAALKSANAKEELVKQHARVAEEAVEGWEKAEKEVASLKLQLEALLKKNSALEDRVGHLDGALKECVRQLNQAKDHQEEKLQEALSRRSREWDSRKTELENQLADLRLQMETSKLDAAKSLQELRPKLEASDKENSSLKLELLKTSQRLEVRTLERDLSAQAAESASKQHLESMKKAAKLEAECRRLKSITRKASFASDQRSSSAYVDSITDSQSDYGEKLQLVENDVKKMDITSRASALMSEDHRKNAVAVSSKIGLMDDFLEMERLASLPEEERNKSENPPDGVNEGENPLKAELESMINRTSSLEEKVEKLEAEKLDLEKALCDYKVCLETSQSELVDAKYRMVELEAHLTECQSQLKTSKGEMEDTNFGLMELKSQFFECQKQLKTAQGQLKDKETELFELRTKLLKYQEQLKNSHEMLQDKENELANLRTQFVEQQEELTTSQWKVKENKSNLTMLQTQLTQSEAQLRSSQEQLKVAEEKLTEIQTQLILTNELNQVTETELKASNSRREEVELQAKALESKTNDLLAKVSILEEEAKKERDLSAQVTATYQELEKELLKIKVEKARPQFTTITRSCNQNMKAEQEKELAVAASRLAECQQTIASLGKQLKSLSSLDDLLELEPERLHESLEEAAASTQLYCRKSVVERLSSIGCQ